MHEKLLFIGSFASSNFLDKLELTFGFITIEEGKITRKGTHEEYETLNNLGTFVGFKTRKLSDSQFIIPGFVDCHTHAPQFPNIGLGLDRPLLEWLDKYTFPLEKNYSDVKFAAKIYDKVIERLLINGTTTACYFGTLNLDGTLELVKNAIERGQRALVGKVSMNIENPVGYYNDTEMELQEVEKFVQKVLNYKNDLVQPVVTPRFAVSCDAKLMRGLAKIASKYGCQIQSHISENLKEIEHVLKINPSHCSYADVYDKSEILNSKCIMAHAIHLTDDEMTLLSKRGVSIAHCPASNTRLKSGLCPVRKYLERNITIGLGTDVSGGDSATILDAMRRCMDVSTYLELNENKERSINWKEAFYLATLGGATALNMEDKIGSLDVGKDFDALLVDAYVPEGSIDHYDYTIDETKEDHLTSLLQRFIYLGDDRNIIEVYVKGVQVKKTHKL